MADRWHWDFEDDERPRAPAGEALATAPPPRPPQDPPRAAGPPRTHIRRRRAVAALAALAALVLLAVVLASRHGKGGAHTAAAAPAHPLRTGGAPVPPSENDKNGAVSSVLAYTPFVKQGAGRGRDVALTFDDGPGPYTPAVLSVLERYGVHATFFVIGRMLEYFGASAQREVRDGDVLGDHTQTHPALGQLSAHQQYEQLFEQAARVEIEDGPRPVLFRPPYGSFNANTMNELRRLHMLMVLWSVDTDDYEQPGVATIVQRALAGAHPGAILLLHDAGGTRSQTVEALPLIIRGLRERGLRPVTVPQLLADDPPVAGQPLPSSLSGD